MDRTWLLASTFYGNWLPGDPRGFVSRVREARPGDPADDVRHEHDMPGTPYDQDFAGLHRHAEQQLKGEPVSLNEEQAAVVLAQLQETAAVRGWRLMAVAVMSNHVHIVVSVPGDPDLKKILGDFKAYASRALTKRWGKPSSETWWTYAGSKRKLATEQSIRAAVEYVRNQANPLIVWVADDLLN